MDNNTDQVLVRGAGEKLGQNCKVKSETQPTKCAKKLKKPAARKVLLL